jgi:ATP/maltotriose-dependent transcriptional regulator MalT/DNA-binding SARP family transcriptional activator
MRGLPDHHVPRPRLTDRCAGHAVVVIEASAGYGKSVLAAELLASWRAVGVEVQLEHAAVSASLLAARLRAAVLRAGYTDAAAAAAEAGDDAVGAVDAVLDALAGEDCVFVVDDAHEALPEAAALVDRMATRIQGAQRLLVLARRLPEGAERLRRAEYVQLSSADLALTAEETLRVCRSGFGLDVDENTARALEDSTGGWTAAAVLAAARAARTGENVRALAAAALERTHPSGAVAAILDQALAALGKESRPALAQLARLPLLDATVVERVIGQPGFFDRALAAGIPFTPTGDGWWDLPGPVRDHLAALAPADPQALRRAASEYGRRREPGEAARLLLAAGDPFEAAALLAEMPPEVLDSMDTLELGALFDELPAEAVDANPRLLIAVARGLLGATKFDRARELVGRAAAIAGRAGDAVLERAANAEIAQELLHQLDTVGAEEVARGVLAEAGPAEAMTRARASHALGFALCNAVDATGRRDQAALAEAEASFARATQLYLELGRPAVASAIAPYWAVSLELAAGRAGDALRRLDRALTLVADRPRRWGYVMAFRIWVAAELGDDDLCRRCFEETLRVAEQLDSDLYRAQAHWRYSLLTSYRGDATATVEHVREAERHKGTWWVPASGDFLAESADNLDRVGMTALAWEYLERVKAEPKDAAYKAALAEAAIEARHGDPERADLLVEEASRTRIDMREYWRLTLFRAYAAFRRGDSERAGALAARAFEEAARLGQEGLPLLRERALSEQLLGLAVETGQPAALALRAHASPVTVSVLGRFEVAQAGRPVPLGSGQEVQLLKLVVLSGGRIHAEQAIDSLWPDADPDTGRNRLRTVLNRLRTTAGPVLGREGDVLVVEAGVQVDLAELLAEARRARSLAPTDLSLAAALARGALARYRGDVLQEDPYAEWAEAPRRRARAAVSDLLNLCADEAAARADLDALRRVVERGIELAPYDDTLYVRAASVLLEQGRRGEALSVVHRARSTFAEIGLQPPDALVALEEAVSA